MSEGQHLAVCSWSLQPTTVSDLIGKLDLIGLNRIQLAMTPVAELDAWLATKEKLEDAGIIVVSGMIETVNEDYSTLESIKRTGGVVPDATWDATWARIQNIVPFARSMELDLLTLHAGFLPEDESDPTYDKLMTRVRDVASLLGDAGIKLGFETGQEDAHTLNAFLDKLERDNVGVNFDPANMILYGMGDPIEALKALAPRLLQCHIKDATRTQTPGEWGAEVPAGEGEVDWSAFFATLQDIGYGVDLAIEREAGDQRVEDIKTARTLAEGFLNG